jgi:hypothetical protein
VTQSLQPRPPERPRRKRKSSGWARRGLVAALAIAVFALGTGLGLALDQGSGASGTQTCQRTLQLVTVTVAKH